MVPLECGMNEFGWRLIRRLPEVEAFGGLFTVKMFKITVYFLLIENTWENSVDYKGDVNHKFTTLWHYYVSIRTSFIRIKQYPVMSPSLRLRWMSGNEPFVNVMRYDMRKKKNRELFKMHYGLKVHYSQCRDIYSFQ